MTDPSGYPSRPLQTSELDTTMTLIGECGGLSSILGIDHEMRLGVMRITTEHGDLYVAPTKEHTVLDLDADPEMHPCGACGALAAEQCRPGCVGHAQHEEGNA